MVESKTKSNSEPIEPVFKIQRAADRHFSSHGWLQTFFSFSFADYYDPQNLNWGALRVLNDDLIAPKSGFETHPHKDMEILTYVLEGELEHKDSLGHHGVVRSGGVQYMSAGTGILHSEKNAGTKPLHLLQMWVVPSQTGLTPNYGQLDLSQDDRLNRLRCVASGQKNVRADIAIHQDASFYIGCLEAQKVYHSFASGRLGFLFVASGKITANGHTLKRGDAVRMARIEPLELDGTGEVVVWDLPEVGLL
ncbi:pirin family protein [Candidatus Micrarchaeota archaeon]|nr:pirin family protein [Candidatus Micrarchaeota archaeon]